MKTTGVLCVVTTAFALLALGPAPASAAPSCKRYYEPGAAGEKLLRCTPRGGVRPTRELGGKKFLGVVGTCWDFDVVALKRCGCRMFEKSSLCCGKGAAAKTCEWRVGNSKWVDCKTYKQPKYGLSGAQENEQCRQELNAADCFKRVRTQALMTPGPCKQLRATCKGDREQAGRDFFNEKCGPLIEDCGCEVDRQCSDATAVQCYDEYRKDKEGIACYFRQAKSPNDKRDCYEALKRQRGGQ